MRKVIHLPEYWAEVGDELIVANLAVSVEYGESGVKVLEVSAPFVRVINECSDYERRPPTPADLEVLKKHIEARGSEWLRRVGSVLAA